MDLDDAGTTCRFLVGDRDAKLTSTFDADFTGAGTQVIKTPGRVPQANAIAGQFVGSIRRKLLDRILIINQRHAASVLAQFQDHFNDHRPHRTPGRPLPYAPSQNRAKPPPTASTARTDSAVSSTNMSRSQ